MSIRVFIAVAEHRSFTAAAQRLGITPAMTSKHVKNLEDRLKTRLLNRNSRHVSLSEAGALYFEQTRPLLETLGEIETAVSLSNTTPTGILKISAPVWLASSHFASLLADYRRKYPDMRFDVDLSGSPVGLLEEGYDLALRASRALDPSLIARHLADIRFLLVAAPTFLDRDGRIKTAEGLNGQPLLAYSGLPLDGRVSSAGQSATIKFDPILRSENEDLLRRAALAGMGYTFLPMSMIEEDLADGRLEIVCEEAMALRVGLYAVYPSRKFLSAKVRTFLDFLTSDAHF